MEQNRRKLFEYAKEKNATDIHISSGSPVLFRIGGKLLPIRKEILTPEQSETLSMELLTNDQKQIFKKNKDYDFMWDDGHARYRINVGFFNGKVGAAIRVLPGKPQMPDQLGLPDTVEKLSMLSKGLVLITGRTSAGKTTTMSAMINLVNQTQNKHIITIEDPIEYVHENNNAVVRQRQVGTDTKSFATGLRAALRQDPDIIAIGEMRDFETIKIALTAAETGILVFSTLHVISIDKIAERLISYAAEDSQNNIRYLLAESLQGIIHQELVPLKSGARKVACEILVATGGVRNILRRKNGHHLRTVISTGKKYGMCSMTDSIGQMLDNNIISDFTASGILANYP